MTVESRFDDPYTMALCLGILGDDFYAINLRNFMAFE